VIYLRKILITTDMSDFSLAAMEYAASLGLLYASNLYCLYVLEHAAPAFKRLDRGEEAKLQQRQAEELAMQELQAFLDRKIETGIKPIPVVRSGAPAEVIGRFARQEEIDLIVMATHGRTGLRHIVMGSVAEKVVRMSSVPVLTVKPHPLREMILDDEDIESELHLG
jgi:universal stress protein A